MSAREQASTVRCPYMPEHVMHVDSLLTHLNRCKATNKHLFRTCLYNSLHVVPRELYDEHIRSIDNFIQDAKMQPKIDNKMSTKHGRRIKRDPISISTTTMSGTEAGIALMIIQVSLGAAPTAAATDTDTTANSIKTGCTETTTNLNTRKYSLLISPRYHTISIS